MRPYPPCMLCRFDQRSVDRAAPTSGRMRARIGEGREQVLGAQSTYRRATARAALGSTFPRTTGKHRGPKPAKTLRRKWSGYTGFEIGKSKWKSQVRCVDFGLNDRACCLRRSGARQEPEL